MALSEDDARRIVNALQAEAVRVEQYVNECNIDSRAKADEFLKRGWRFEANAHTTVYPAWYSADLSISVALSLVFEGLVWITCGQRGRGVGTFESGASTLGKWSAAWSSNLVQYDRVSDSDYPDFYNKDPGVVCRAITEVGQAASLLKARKPVSLVDQLEVLVDSYHIWAFWSSGGPRNLWHLLSRVKYDVEEALSKPAATDASLVGAKLCSECGHSLRESAKFCDNCGGRV